MCGTVPASKVLRYQFQIECKQSRSSTSLVAKGNGRRGRGHIGVGAIRWGFFSTPPSADSIGRFSPTATLTGAAGSTGVGITLLGPSAVTGKVLRYQFQIECKQSRSSTSLVAKGNGRRGRGHIGVGAIRWGFFSTPPSADSIGRFSPTATLTGAAGSTGVGITLLGPSAVTGWGAILFV